MNVYLIKHNDKFNNELREVTKFCYVPSQSKYYIVVKPDWFQKNISPVAGRVMDCYVGSFHDDVVEGGEKAKMSSSLTISS